jgi:hypothetical protein
VLNPVWLLGDTQRNREWPFKWLPQYILWALWFLRNPACNACSVVIGVSHRTRTVAWARGDGHTYVDGWNWGYCKADESKLILPFVSYRSAGFKVFDVSFRGLEFMWGWKTSGAFTPGMIRIANAKNAT